MLRTRAARVLVILFVALVGGGAGASWSTTRIVRPTEFGYSAVVSSAIDIRAPGNRMIVDFFDVDTQIDKNCRFVTPMLEYRGVWLCKRDEMSAADFDSRIGYFRTLVDEDYSSYHAKIAKALSTGAALGLGIWFACVVIYGLGRWVLAAPR